MKIIPLTLVFAVLFTLISVKLYAQEIRPQTLFITEFFPNPEGSDSGKEWVELFNNSDETITYTNLEIVTISAAGNERITSISEITVEPFSYFLILESANIAPDFTQKLVVGDGMLNLYNDGQFIRLQDRQNNILDEIEYSTTPSAKSWERNGISDIEGCNLLDLHLSSNSIGIPNTNFEDSCWGEQILDPEPEPVNAEILFSSDNVSFANSIYTLSGQQIYLDFTMDSTLEVTDYIYYLDDGTQVYSPFSSGNYVNRPINLQVTLENNEIHNFQSLPISIFPIINLNEYSFENNQNLIEVFNPNAFDIMLSNYQLAGFAIQENTCSTIINPNSFCVITIPESLNEITLQVGDLIIETLQSDSLKASFFEGSWYSDFENSLGAENLPPSTLIINEIYPSPNSGEKEWIEIYNYGNFALDLKNYYLKDKVSSGGFGTTKSFLPNIILKPDQYYVVNDFDLKISLNNSGDLIGLFNQNDKLLNEVEYPEIPKGMSYSRINNEFVKSYKSTPGFINEIISQPIASLAPKKSTTSPSVKKEPKVGTNNINPSSQVLGTQETSFKLPDLVMHNNKDASRTQIQYEINLWPVQLFMLFIFSISLWLISPSFRKKTIRTICIIRNFFKTLDTMEYKAAKQNTEFSKASRYEVFA